MKTHFQHIASLLLAVLVLVSTQSYSINTHYCGNILVDKAIMKPAKKCAMHDTNSSLHHEHDDKKDDCCDDEVELIEGQDQLKVQSLDFELPNPVFFEAFVYTFIFNTSFEALEKVDYSENPPPLLLRDFQAHYQVFLI